jgi:predicted transcriptional regulator
MAAAPAPASIAITVRLSADIVARLDALALATERTRSYWVQQAVEEVIERELWQVRDIEEAIAEDDADPEEGMTGGAFETWMIEEGLTTRQALDQAEARRRQ